MFRIDSDRFNKAWAIVGTGILTIYLQKKWDWIMSLAPPLNWLTLFAYGLFLTFLLYFFVLERQKAKKYA